MVSDLKTLLECESRSDISKSCMSRVPSKCVRRPLKRSLDQSFQARQMGAEQMRMSRGTITSWFFIARSVHNRLVREA